MFGESSKIRKVATSTSSTISKVGSKFLTPTKKLDCLWPSRTIPQDREASPRPLAYINLTEDPGMSYDQPSSTTLENKGQPMESQIGSSEVENSRDCDQQIDQKTQMENYTDHQLDQPLLLEPIDLQEDPAPVAQDVPLPQEELQILQSVDSPSQVVTDKKETDEGENSKDQLEIEEQVEEKGEGSLETKEQNQDPQ